MLQNTWNKNDTDRFGHNAIVLNKDKEPRIYFQTVYAYFKTTNENVGNNSPWTWQSRRSGCPVDVVYRCVL